MSNTDTDALVRELRRVDPLDHDATDLLESAAHTIERLTRDERYLRRLLAARVAMPGTYYDDGEAQGQEHGISIDFMREPVADIEAKLMALNVARLEVKPLPPYYIGGPYRDGSYAMCVTSTGKVVHREPSNAGATR